MDVSHLTSHKVYMCCVLFERLAAKITPEQPEKAALIRDWIQWAVTTNVIWLSMRAHPVRAQQANDFLVLLLDLLPAVDSGWREETSLLLGEFDDEEEEDVISH